MTTVSVIIPCYNSGEFIDEAIQSVLDQTYKDLEIIVIDDGSTDDLTINVLNNSRWDRTRILRQENMGLPAARNAGIRAALGEFILPLDADDRIDPSYVEKALAVMHAQPNIGIVYCKAMRFGEITGPWLLPPFSLQAMVNGNVIFCTALYRKCDWEKVGGYREVLRHGLEDYDFWIRMLSLGIDVYQIDEYLFYYRVQKTSMAKTLLSNREVFIATNAEIFRNNIDFFAQHADKIYRHNLDLYDENQKLRKPVDMVAKLFNKTPTLRKWVKSIFRYMIEK
jgi:glycosyltransferase involved in cell wall biosynthesis